MQGYTKPFCYKILPLVYDDALSYYEQVCGLITKTNELVEYVNNFDSTVLEKAKAYTDTQINNIQAIIMNDVKKQIDGLAGVYDDKLKVINDNFDALKLEVRQYAEQVAVLSGNISALYDSFEEYKKNMDSRFVSLTNELQQYIDERVSKLDRLYVISPATNKLVSIQVALNEMWNALNVGALTAYEYDSLGLTAKQYDNYGMTAFIYDTKARFILFDLIYNKMRSPFTGLVVSMKEMIYKLFDYHKQEALTALEYDMLTISANLYDSQRLTAYQYDWNGKTLLQNI